MGGSTGKKIQETGKSLNKKDTGFKVQVGGTVWLFGVLTRIMQKGDMH